MREQMEGSRGVAEAVALSRPQVISAYPITPQSHIVEHLSVMVKDGRLDSCRFVNAESEFGAMSIVIGAAVAGSRSYTATASQGLLFMAEAVYNAGGLELPIVMTVGNRAVGAPINIWNDHSDAMAVRDAGWVQLFATSNQEAVDLHLLAFRLAQEASIPVMVCMDGYVLTHAFDEIDVPSQQQVDEFLPPFRTTPVLDPADPVSIGSMVGPEAFTEVRYLAYAKHQEVLQRITALAAELGTLLEREVPALVRDYRLIASETVIVSMGSVSRTVDRVVDTLRAGGRKVGSMSLTSYRPFPAAQVRAALAVAKRVVVVDRAMSAGAGGIVTADVRSALSGLDVRVYSVMAGLGGRPVRSS